MARIRRSTAPYEATMSYRKHGFRVLTEGCFKQTAIKYVDTSIKPPYRQFCCPVSLISTSPSANIPVSPRFFCEFDGRCLSAAILKNHSVPVLGSSPKTGCAIFSRFMVTSSKEDCTTDLHIWKVVVQRIKICNSN